MTEILLIFSLACLAALLAAVIRILCVWFNRTIFRQGFFADSSVHWLLIQTINKNPRFSTIPQYLIGDEPASYPRGFHLYASLFPLATVKRFPWLPNLILYSLFSGIFFAYSAYYFRGLAYPPLLGGGLALAFFLFAISNLTFDGPAIAYLKLSERLFARLTGSLYFLAMAIGLTFDSSFSLALSAIAGAIALNSSKFGRQAIVFVTPLVALFMLSPMPLLILTGATAGAFLIGQGHFLHSVKSQIKHLIVYHTAIRKSNTPKRALSCFIDLKTLFDWNTGYRSKLKNILFREPTRTVIRYPELLILLAIWASFTPLNSPALAIGISTVLVYLGTTTNLFSYLGESYRYLEYNLSFLMPLLLAQLFLAHPPYLPLAIIFLLYALLVTAVLTRAFRNPTAPAGDTLQEFLEGLNLQKDDVVFPVSMRLGADICARAPCKSFWWQPGNITQAIFDKFIEDYPYLKRDWRPLAREFNVNYVLIDKAAAAAVDWSYDFSGLPTVLENDRYLALKVKS